MAATRWQPLDRALLDRMVMIYVETDYNCWARYAREQRFDDGVQQFLAVYPNLLAKPGCAARHAG